jgi:hypothetical protein
MRSLLLLALLSNLVSCVSKTEEKSCTYNGQPCIEEETSQKPDGQPSPLQEAVLQVGVKSSITISRYEVEFLENTLDSTELTLRGNIYECEAKTEAGSFLTYKISLGYLTLMEEKRDGTVKLQTFERKAGLSNRLEGSWETSSNYGNRVEFTKLEISPTHMSIKVECRFSKQAPEAIRGQS